MTAIGTAIALTGMAYDDGDVLGWWYICIGLGFVALSARALLAGAPGWSVGLRLVVAVGFVLLGVAELQRHKKSKRS